MNNENTNRDRIDASYEAEMRLDRQAANSSRSPAVTPNAQSSVTSPNASNQTATAGQHGRQRANLTFHVNATLMATGRLANQPAAHSATAAATASPLIIGNQAAPAMPASTAVSANPAGASSHLLEVRQPASGQQNNQHAQG